MAINRRRVLVGSSAFLFGALALALLLLLAWLQSDDFQRRATRLIENLVEDKTGEQLTLGRVSIGLWPPMVEVDQLNLWSGSTGETIASAEHIRAPLVIRGGKIQLGELRLDAPFVQVHLDEKGKLVEFANRPKGDGPPNPLKELPFGSLRVTDGTLRVVYPQGEAAISHLSVTPDHDTVVNLAASLDVQVKAFTQHVDIDWKAIELGPTEITLPAFALQAPLINIEGRAKIPLQGDLDIRVKGGARLDELNTLFVAPNALFGEVQFDVGVSGPPADPLVEAAVLGSDIGVDKVGRNDYLIHHRFGNLHASVEWTKAGTDIEKAVFQWGDGKLTVWGHITPDLTLEDGHLLGEDLSLAHVFRQLDAFRTPWVDLQVDVEADLEGTLKPLDIGGAMDFALADLVVADRPVDDPDAVTTLAIPHGTLTGNWSMANNTLTFDVGLVTTPNSRGTALASISTNGGPVDVTAHLSTANLIDLRPLGGSELTGIGKLNAHIHGLHSVFYAEGDGDLRGFSVTGLPYADHLVSKLYSPDMKRLIFENAQGRKGETDYTGTLELKFAAPMAMDLALTIPDGQIRDVVGVFIDLPSMTGKMSGTMHIAGPLLDLDGRADLALSDVTLWGEKFPVGEGHGFMDHGLFTLDDLRVARGDGTEGIVLRGGIDRQWKLNMEMVGDGLLLEHLNAIGATSGPVTGRLGFLARIDNTLFEPEPHGRLFLTDVRYAGRPVDDSLVRFHSGAGVVSYEGKLVGKTVDVAGTLGMWGEQPYQLHADFDQFPAHIAYPVAADGGPVQAIVSGALDLSGHFGDTPSPVDIVADAHDVAVRWAGQELKNDGAWHYEQHGRRFELERFALAGGTSRFELSASGGDVPLDVAGHGTIDMDLLRMVVPGLERSDGSATIDVSATGRAPDVLAQVDIALDGALVRHSSFPASFEDVTAKITGGRDGYNILGNAGLGGGQIDVWGRIEAENWYPSNFQLGAKASNAQVQWVDYLPPAIGDAQMQFDGPPSALLLSGHVDIDEMTFSDRIDWEDWVVVWQDELLVSNAPNESDSLFSFDVEIDADNTVRLRNNVAEGTASAHLRVIGDTARPGLVGTVDVTDAVAYLQDREFNVDRGEIAFRDPWTWDPDLDFDLITDITSRERRYRINYLVNGPFSNWHSETRSEPALPQADVNALLWFGMTAEELEEMGELSQAIGQGVADMILADFFVSNQTAAELRGELPTLFDRLDLATGVNARGEYSPDPRLRVEKRLEDFGGIDITAEIDLARTSDQYYRVDAPISDAWSLSGWYATRQRDRNLPIGGAYGIDLRARWESN